MKRDVLNCGCCALLSMKARGDLLSKKKYSIMFSSLLPPGFKAKTEEKLIEKHSRQQL
jgi:hypothetical protein